MEQSGEGLATLGYNMEDMHLTIIPQSPNAWVTVFLYPSLYPWMHTLYTTSPVGQLCDNHSQSTPLL